MSAAREAAELLRRSLVVDLHCDLLLTTALTGWDWGRRHRRNPLPGAPLMGHLDLPRLEAGGVDGMLLGIVTAPWQGPSAVDRALSRMEDRLRRHPDRLALVRAAADLQACAATGRVGCMAVLEGAHPLRDRLDLLPAFRERGLLSVGLVHFTANRAARPMVGWGAGPGEGLTGFGRELLDTLEELRILVDLAHLDRPGLLEACARARAPVICSHTACLAVQRSRRNLDDEQIRAVAATGGVIGLVFVAPFLGAGGLARAVEHLEHMRRVAGPEHIALGSDWEGFAIYPRDLDGPERLPDLVQALLEAGWPPEHVRGLLGANFLRAFREACG